MTATHQRFGFIGAGNMATALARGFISAGRVAADAVLACDPSMEAAAAFEQATGARTVATNADVAEACDVVFLAVKPQYFAAAAESLAGALTARHLVVSVIAGVTLGPLADRLGAAPRLVRVMPNTPCLIGQGASGYTLGPGTTADDGRLVAALLAAVGVAVEVEEPLLDAVTGLSGSGPAFVYQIIEALSDGGVRMGLPRAIATMLAAKTVAGAAAMVLETGEHPAVLKDQVASPGGTTIRGLQAMEEHAVRAGLYAAVEAATLRATELAQSTAPSNNQTNHQAKS